jgi:hypothetical protein
MTPQELKAWRDEMDWPQPGEAIAVSLAFLLELRDELKAIKTRR